MSSTSNDCSWPLLMTPDEYYTDKRLFVSVTPTPQSKSVTVTLTVYTDSSEMVYSTITNPVKKFSAIGSLLSFVGVRSDEQWALIARAAYANTCVGWYREQLADHDPIHCSHLEGDTLNDALSLIEQDTERLNDAIRSGLREIESVVSRIL